MFANTHCLTVEWGDCDPAGIVFYPRFFAMFDAATAYLLEAASGFSRAALIHTYGIVRWPIRAAFSKTPVSFDNKIRIESLVTGAGRSSFEISHHLFHDGRLCVECVETRVWCGARNETGSLCSRPIPEELRRKLLHPALPNLGV